MLIWLTLLSVLWWHGQQAGVSATDLLRWLYEVATESGYGPAIYIVAYVSRPLLFFPATLLTLLAGAMFGPVWGVVYTIIGENLSANLAYGIGRFLSQRNNTLDTARESIAKQGLSRWHKRLQQHSFNTVLILRLSFLPFDLVNYGCGLLRVVWPAYAAATFVGILPGLIAFVNAGAAIQLHTLLNADSLPAMSQLVDSRQLLLAGLLLGLALLLMRALGRRLK